MSSVHYRSMMSPTDSIIWHIERDPLFRSTIMGIWELDGEPTPERMLESVDRMVSAIPRLTQRVVESRPRPRWVAVESLDLAAHYSTHSIGPDATFDDAMGFAQSWVREPFDRDQPLWQLGLLTGLVDGKAAIVIKVHHSIADGIGMVLMLAAFTDLEPNPTTRIELDQPEESPRVRYTRAQRLATRARAITKAARRGPSEAGGRFARLVWSATKLVWPNRTPHSRLMTDRTGTLELASRTVPLRAVKDAGRSAGVSVNDVFVAIVTDAVGRYHDRSGVECPRLRLHMPVNIRNARTASLAGNQFVPARVNMRVPARCSTAGLVSVHSQLERLRAEPALPHINAVSAMIQKLGKFASRTIIGGMMKGVDVLASNVPGPPFPIYVAGSRVMSFIAIGPPAGAAINVTLFSYQGNLHLGIATDAGAVTDRAAFLACLDDAIHATTGVAAPTSALITT